MLPELLILKLVGVFTVNFQFDPYSPEVAADPFPLYKVMRDEFPCYWSEAGNTWCLSRYEDIKSAGRDWETFSSTRGNTLNDSPERAGNTLGTTDPPRHDEMRALVNLAFSRRNVDYLIEPARVAARENLQSLLKTGATDFLWDVTVPTTASILSELVGIDPKDHKFIREATNKIVAVNPSKAEDTSHAMKEMYDYATQLVNKRQAKSEGDIVSLLLEAEIDGKRLSEEEVRWTTLTLIAAGMESASSFISIFALNIATEPKARDMLLSDMALIPNALEESLRFNTSAQRFRRTLTRDVDWHGQTMRKGDSVLLMYGSANRDERQFENPDVYDIHRDCRGHLGFGHGKHICLGSHVARLIACTLIEELLTVAPTYIVNRDELEWMPAPVFRGMTGMPISLT